MTEQTISHTDHHRAVVAQLITVVQELQFLRERLATELQRDLSFRQAVDSLAGANPCPAHYGHLRELAEILDSHSAEDVRLDLDGRWRDAMTSNA